MNDIDEKRTKRVAPRASVLIESLRDIGYSLQTAVADVIDNSVTAGARRIELLAETDPDAPAIGILDDGVGMSQDELFEAMRFGTRSPLEGRDATDLGRFGLGLKTASFSQCRRLTVLTCRKSVASSAAWDLDTVSETDEWLVETPRDHGEIPWVDRLDGDGTLVIWQKLDRLVDSRSKDSRQNLVRQIDNTASHVEFVFHRFLSGEAGLKRIEVYLNGRRLRPFDPFCSRHAATQFGQEEVFMLDGKKIHIQHVTLPHHAKVSRSKWKRNAGAGGYLKNQGFYLYRNRRLIVHGTWFGMARQTELTKLSRVRIDIPNSLDAAWKIDVKKASAQPPPPVRQRLRHIMVAMGAASRRAYTKRGTRLVEENPLPVWTRTQNKNRISYGLASEHPSFLDFAKDLDSESTHKFRRLIDLIVSTLPIDSLFADICGRPEELVAPPLDKKSFSGNVESVYLTLRQQGVPRDQVEQMMSAAEPFRSRWNEARRVIANLEK